MALTINTNLSSLMVQLSLKKSTLDLNRALEQMTTGYRINSAKDDAAGYAVATKMNIDLSSYSVVRNNANLGLSLLNTAESSLDIVTTHLQRIRDLAEQAANGTYGQDSIQAIQMEIDQRTEEINRIMATTEYNGIKLFEGNGIATNAITRHASGASARTVTGSFLKQVNQLTEEEAIAQGYTIIKTAADLDNIRNNLSGKYILMNDIDLSGINWEPIGGLADTSVLPNPSDCFQGELNGNGYTINNLTVNNPSGYGGLFGATLNAEIKNLGLENVDINGFAAGGLSYATVDTSISNCYVTDSVSGDLAGGFIGADGYFDSYGGNSSISDCYSSVNVSYIGFGGGAFIGGIDTFAISISNCYYDTQLAGGLPGIAADGTTAGDANSKVHGVTTDELNNLLVPPGYGPNPGGGTGTAGTGSITLQVGIDSSENSRISFDTALSINLNVNVSTTTNARNALDDIDAVLDTITAKQTEFGAVQNRLESVIDSLDVSIENTTSSLSTIKDADIAKVSSDFIRAQILQQASATLLATANQSPSVALGLI